MEHTCTSTCDGCSRFNTAASCRVPHTVHAQGICTLRCSAAWAHPRPHRRLSFLPGPGRPRGRPKHPRSFFFLVPRGHLVVRTEQRRDVHFLVWGGCRGDLMAPQHAVSTHRSSVLPHSPYHRLPKRPLHFPPPRPLPPVLLAAFRALRMNTAHTLAHLGLRLGQHALGSHCH